MGHFQASMDLKPHEKFGENLINGMFFLLLKYGVYLVLELSVKKS